MWRSLASNMLTVLAVILFLLAGVILWGKREYTAEGPLGAAICLRVDRGSNMTKVSRDLE
ncbi:MAG: branched-chain alpha-keto acid dehydrogenase subunit E2, partial [Pseudodonghicola sp.]